MDEFKAFLVEERVRPKTMMTYLNEVEKFIDWYMESFNPKKFEPENVSSLDIQDYVQYLSKVVTVKKGGEERKLSPKTVAKKVESIRTYFRSLVENGRIKENPVSKVRLTKVHNKNETPRWLNRNEKNKLVRVVNEPSLWKNNMFMMTRNRAIVYLGLHAGLRPIEIVNLEINDINYEKEFIEVDGKGGKYRKLELNKDAIFALKEWLSNRPESESKKLFLSQKGELSIDGLHHMFRNLKKKSGIDELTAHVLRHTFAHDLAEKGYPIQLIADLMGHSDINTTRVYLKSDAAERRDALNSLSSIRVV